MSKEKHLPFALTNDEKVSEKVKQIEEMAKDICKLGISCEECTMLARKTNQTREQYCKAFEYAKRAYNAGYRKQSEDTVEVVRCKNCKHWADTSFDTVTEEHWGECQKPLGDYRYCETAENDYCSYGEMKGGAE